jgi:hypothetical protein
MDAHVRGRTRLADALLAWRRQHRCPYSDAIGDNPLFWQLLDRTNPDQVRVYTGSVAEFRRRPRPVTPLLSSIATTNERR